MADNASVQNARMASDERIRELLRRHIQRAYDSRTFTRTQLAAESGVNVYQIDAIMSRDVAKQRRVACEDALCLAYTLGDSCVTGLVAQIAYTARREGEADPLSPMMIAATAMTGLSVIASAAADGRIDHTESGPCRDAADLIMATVKPLSSAGVSA